MTSTSAPLLRPLRDYIDGAWSAPSVELGPVLRDPNDGRRLAPVVATDRAGVEAALAASARAEEAGVWSDLSPEERASALERVASEAESRVEEMALADACTTGVVVSLTRTLAGLVPVTFREAAKLLRAGVTLSRLPGAHGDVEVHRLPWGPAAVIAPWNGPSVITSHKVASALAAGCPVILKPSEWAPHSCGLIAEAVVAAGIPAGAFQLVHGAAEVGAQLVADPRVRAVSLTGGLAAGRAVARACADTFKPAQLELGGNNALVVLEDADLDRAAEAVALGLTTLNGQWCRALGRLVVHERLASALLDRALARLAAVKLGSSLSPASDMGPLIHAEHRDHVVGAAEALVKKGGAMHRATPLPDLPGWFLAPTLITGCASGDALDEIFGPVATVHTFATEAEALALANHAPFGLAGYVFSRDERRALAFARKMRTGGVKVNGISLRGLHPMAPRAAWGLSGMGEEGTLETLRFFCGTRVVGVAG